MNTFTKHEADLVLSSANLLSKIGIEDAAIDYAIHTHQCSISMKLLFLITSLNLSTRVSNIEKVKTCLMIG